jgi:hypothetical protein
MAKQIIAAELLGVASRPQANSHALHFRMPNGETAELVFPSDQLPALIEAALQADQPAAPPVAAPASIALLAESFKLDLQAPHQTVRLELHVGNRTFSFALFREHALRLMSSIGEMLPAR